MPIKTHMDERLFPLDNMTSSDVGVAKKESRLLQKVSVSKKKKGVTSFSAKYFAAPSPMGQSRV